jgi:hypothetical protein
MAASLARHNARPQALGEHLSVVLISRVVGDLRRLQRRTRLSTTDLANRAITSYEFFDAQLRAGRDVIVRDNGTGETRLVRFLDGPGRTSTTPSAPPVQVGPTAPHRRQVASGGYTPIPGGVGWPANDRQDSLPLAGLAGQEVRTR